MESESHSSVTDVMVFSWLILIERGTGLLQNYTNGRLFAMSLIGLFCGIDSEGSER